MHDHPANARVDERPSRQRRESFFSLCQAELVSGISKQDLLKVPCRSGCNASLQYSLGPDIDAYIEGAGERVPVQVKATPMRAARCRDAVCIRLAPRRRMLQTCL